MSAALTTLNAPLEAHRFVLDCVQSGVYVVDTNRRIVIWNPAAEKISGHGRRSIEGRCCGDTLLAHVDRNGIPLCKGRCPLAATLADGLPRNASVFLRHQCGHRVAVEVHIERITDGTGRVLGAVESFVRKDPRQLAAEPVGDSSSMDPLTGLPDGRHAALQLSVLLAEARVFGLPITGVFLKLDPLPGGETMVRRHALLAVARTLADAFPKALVARWDTTSFLIIESDPTEDPGGQAALAEGMVSACQVEHDGAIVKLSARAAAMQSLAADDASAFIWRLERSLLGGGANGGGGEGDFVGV